MAGTLPSQIRSQIIWPSENLPKSHFLCATQTIDLSCLCREAKSGISGSKHGARQDATAETLTQTSCDTDIAALSSVSRKGGRRSLRLTLAYPIWALEVEPAGQHHCVKVGGSVYAGIGILDPHIAQSDDGFKAPLEMTSHPECNTRLDAKVKILEFLQAIPWMIRIRIDVVWVLIKYIRYVRPEAEDNAEPLGIQMIAQGQEDIGAGHQIGVTADSEHADKTGRLGSNASTRHQRKIAAQTCVKSIGKTQGGSQHRKAETVVADIQDLVVFVAPGLIEGTVVELDDVFNVFTVPETISLSRQEGKGQQYSACAQN